MKPLTLVFGLVYYRRGFRHFTLRPGVSYYETDELAHPFLETPSALRDYLLMELGIMGRGW